MAGIKYTKEQIKELQSNRYVKSVSEKYLTFTKECKIEFLEQSKQGIFYRDIFNGFGLPKYIVNSPTPERCYQRWVKNERDGEVEKTKGRKKSENDPEKMSKDEYIEYLEMKLAIAEELKKIDSGNYP